MERIVDYAFHIILFGSTRMDMLYSVIADATYLYMYLYIFTYVFKLVKNILNILLYEFIPALDHHRDRMAFCMR